MNNTSLYMLHYRGPGCGGVCLPFEETEAAQAYATERGATSFQIERRKDAQIVRSGQRKDCRYKWEVQ